MKKAITLALGLSMCLSAGAVYADDKCDDPISSWQPREVLRKQLEAKGWSVYRIKVDDSCYEVKALDENGKRIEAIFSPASLELIEIEHEDDDDDDHDDDKHNEHSDDHNKHRSAIQPDSTEIIL